MTPLDIILMALKDTGVLGVGQSAQAEDINDAFTKMNMMLSQWQRKRWLVFQLVDLPCPSTGKQFYTIGPIIDPLNPPDIVVTERPERLEDAYVRLLTAPSAPVDTPLQVLTAREDYDRVAMKQLSSFPNSVFYDSGYPTGKIYPVPIAPAAMYQVHVVVKQELGQFTSLNQTVTLPPEYHAAILYNLAVRLRPAYQLPPDPAIVALAMDALDTVRGANTQIGMLSMPSEISRPGVYNPYSDQIR